MNNINIHVYQAELSHRVSLQFILIDRDRDREMREMPCNVALAHMASVGVLVRTASMIFVR